MQTCVIGSVYNSYSCEIFRSEVLKHQVAMTTFIIVPATADCIDDDYDDNDIGCYY